MTFLKTDAIYLGSTPEGEAQYLPLKWGNRHGLVAGATGTGKTVTLQILAEGFSAAGVPVFMADVKGDLTGLCAPSSRPDFLVARAQAIGFESEYEPRAFPAEFWDLFGEKGSPVRSTVSEMGPLLLSRILELNDTQSGVLDVAFRVADEEGLLLLDLKDLRAFLNDIVQRRAEISARYGNVAPQSVATVLRNLLRLENQGAEAFFGEPALDILDFMRTSADGRGQVNILAADRLMNAPRLYATFLLWMLSELFEALPEAGDLERPKLVFFFDEAHLLFTDAPKPLLEKIEQVVRLVRSKGVGIFFVTQNPEDVPETVLAQLGNRVQHALRAFTPAQEKFIRQAAQTYRPNPAFKVETVITELAVGEALVSTLDARGQPGIVQRTLIRPPSSLLGPAPAETLATARKSSRLSQRYTALQDRESAYEILHARAQANAKVSAPPVPQPSPQPAPRTQDPAPAPPTARTGAPGRPGNRQGIGEAAIKSVVRSMGSSVGRMIVREVLRGIMGSMRR